MRPIHERMSRNSPQPEERSAGSRTDYEHVRQSGLAGDYVSEFEASVIRFTISCSLLVGLVAVGAYHGFSLDFAILATSVGAMIVMIHNGQIEDPSS